MTNYDHSNLKQYKDQKYYSRCFNMLVKEDCELYSEIMTKNLQEKKKTLTIVHQERFLHPDTCSVFNYIEWIEYILEPVTPFALLNKKVKKDYTTKEYTINDMLPEPEGEVSND